MGRNRAQWSPLELVLVTASLATFFNKDVYAVEQSIGTPVTITLDPNAVEGDQAMIQDVAGNAAAQPITVAGGGNSIVGVGASYVLGQNFGQVTFTFSDEVGGWIVSNVGQAGPVRATVQTVFVYDQSAASGGNVYNTQIGPNGLDAAVAGATGPKIVQVRNTPTLNAATWSAFDDVTIVGVPQTGIAVPLGAVTITGPITGVSEFKNTTVTYTGGTPFLFVPASTIVTLRLDNFQLPSSASSFLNCTAASALLVLYCGTSSGNCFVSNGVPFITTAAAPCLGVSMTLLGTANIGSNTLTGPSNKFFGVQYPDAQLNKTQLGVTGGTVGLSLWPVASSSQNLSFYVKAGPVALPSIGVLQTTFGGLADMVALAAAAGTQVTGKIIEFEGNSGTTFPAGAYNYAAAQGNTSYTSEFKGVGKQSTLTFAPGATFTGVGKFTNAAIVCAPTVGNAVTSFGGAPNTQSYIFRQSTVTNNDAGTFVSVTGANSRMFLKDESSFLTGLGVHVSSALASLVIDVDSTSAIQANTLACDAGLSITVNVAPGGYCSPNQPQCAGGTLTINSLVPAHGSSNEVASGAVAGPSGQLVGGTVSVTPSFNPITIVRRASGKVRVAVNINLGQSVANPIYQFQITAKPTAGGNYAAQATTTFTSALGAAGTQVYSFFFDFDGVANAGTGAGGLLPFDANGSVDIGFVVSTSAGTIQSFANVGCMTADEQ